MYFFVKKYFSEDKIEKGMELLEELRDASVKEDGCIKYEIFKDVDDELCLIIFEQWEDENFQIAHTKTEHFNRLIPLINECLSKDNEITKFIPIK